LLDEAVTYTSIFFAFCERNTWFYSISNQISGFSCLYVI